MLLVSSLSSNKKKKYSRKSNKNEEFVPYRVLGNLSIKGKIMNVSCMSDRLLKKCNDIINNIAGKYIVYLGDKYTELQHDTKENELDVNLKQKSKDNNMISHASEKIFTNIVMKMDPTCNNKTNRWFF